MTTKLNPIVEAGLGTGFKKLKMVFGKKAGDPRAMKQRLKDNPDLAKDAANRKGKLGGMAELQRRVATKMQKEDMSLFSDKELAFLEAMAVAPTPENQAPSPTAKNKAEGGKGKGSLAEAKRGRPPKEEGLGVNELHMNAKRAADNMSNVVHKFANGERVKMTKNMGSAFLSRHSAAKTADEKDAILNYAHQSPQAFEKVAKGGEIPKAEKTGIKLGSMKDK